MMASFKFEASAEFIKTLGRLAEIDRLAPKMLDAAVPTIEANLKSDLSGHRDSGSLLGSIKKTKAKKSKNGHKVTVRPTGMDNRGVRNMAKFAYLEFGVKKRGGGWKQAPTPTITKTLNDSAPKVYSIMREVFESEVGL